MISDEFSPSGSETAVPELVLMPLDPYHLHAYWHIEADDAPAVQKGQQSGGNNDLSLRIYCRNEAQPGQSNNNDPWFDIALGTERNSCDVRLPLDHLRCRAALGRKSDNRPFLPLLFSNRVQAPKAGPTAVGTVATETLTGVGGDRLAASATANLYDERLIDAIIRQALSDRNIAVKLNPHSDCAAENETKQTRMTPARSSHTIAHRHRE